MSRTLNRVHRDMTNIHLCASWWVTGADFSSVLNPVCSVTEKKLQMERTSNVRSKHSHTHSHTHTQIPKQFAGRNSSVCQWDLRTPTQYFHRIYKYNISIWQEITSSSCCPLIWRNSLFGVGESEGLKVFMCHGKITLCADICSWNKPWLEICCCLHLKNRTKS